MECWIAELRDAQYLMLDARCKMLES